MNVALLLLGSRSRQQGLPGHCPHVAAPCSERLLVFLHQTIPSTWFTLLPSGLSSLPLPARASALLLIWQHRLCMARAHCSCGPL